VNPRRITQAIIVTAALAITACGGDDDDAAPLDTDAPATTDAPEAVDAPTTGPASIAVLDQVGDGTSVTIDSVTLPTDGFIVVHADADGSPGPILGWSDLLPAGESIDVTVDLNEPITATAVVHPMGHVDANGNGEYEFMPPDVTIDVPATTAEGGVAMLPITYTIEDAGDTDQQEAASSLQLVSSPLGEVLADADGWILYLFAPDEQGESTCYDECEANWPVVGELTSVGEGLDPALLGTTTRTDGAIQATYNDWPLYNFAGDPSPGLTNGQGLNGVWWVIDAAGDAVGV
jgi:predicted lipoprotein with Yx(FWY)xxD motif